MLSVGFEPTISGGERPKTHALDRAVLGPATYILIDVAIPGDRKVIKKEAENILKYKDLIMQIQRLWNVKIKSDTGNNRGD